MQSIPYSYYISATRFSYIHWRISLQTIWFDAWHCMHQWTSLMLIQGRLWKYAFHVYSISLLISKKSNQPTQQKFTVVIASNKLLYQQHPAMHNLLMVAYLDNKNRHSKETGDATKTCCCNFASNNIITGAIWIVSHLVHIKECK